MNLLNKEELLLKIQASNANCNNLNNLKIKLKLLRDNIWKCDGEVWKYHDGHPENTNLPFINTAYLLHMDDVFQLDLMLCGGLYSSIARSADVLIFPTMPLESHYCCGVIMNTDIDVIVELPD